jgi:hypothetical protein
MRLKLGLLAAVFPTLLLVYFWLSQVFAVGASGSALTGLANAAGISPASAPAVASQARAKPTPTPSAAPPAPVLVRCHISVPANPLTAEGLSDPYLLAGPGDGHGCHEGSANTGVFVQAAVLDPATGQISIYNPLVADRGSRPAIAPTVPTLPKNAVVGIWFGFNGDRLTLDGSGSRSCIQGVHGSIFNQNAFCNSEDFFDAANAAVKAGKLTVPPLGTAKDGRACPSTRDFSVVDQDQSDNTTTTYLVTSDGRTAQDTPQNRAKLKGATIAKNGSDERLLAIALDGALGCTPWTAPDLADPTHTVRLTALPLNEMQAAAHQAPPVALVPALDPFVQIDGKPSLDKLNAYRAGDDQPTVSSLAAADAKPYCHNLLQAGLPRIVADQKLTAAAASPFPDQANSLFNFLALRFQGSYDMLTCQKLLGLVNPITVTTDANGVVVGAKINLHPARG